MLKRILMIVLLLVAYRILAHVPVPLGEPGTFKDAVQSLITSTDFGNFLNLVSGGGLTDFSIILIGISPFITASIVFQLLGKAIPAMEEMQKDGETGRRKINQWTRIATLPLAILQSTAYTYLLYQSVIAANSTAIVEPSSMEWIISITSMTCGSMLLMWFGELMTEQGIGNGTSMIIFAGIVSQLPKTLATLGTALMDTSEGQLSVFGWFDIPVNPTIFFVTIGYVISLILVVFILVKLNEGQKVITINYAKRVHGNSAYGGIKSILPIKIIAAGVIPVIFATAFLSLPALVGQIILTANPQNEFAMGMINLFTAPSANNFATMYPDGITAQWFFYPAIYFLLVIMFTYFYTDVMFNVDEISDNLQKQGAFIEGVRPGARTAEYLGKVISHLNLFGSISLGLIALIPFATDYIFILTMGYPLGLSISGTGLLIVVTVALENLRSIDSRALMVTYDDYKNESKS